MAWVAVVLDDFLCFPKASCVVDASHGWEMAADDALCCLHHPLEGLVISSGTATKPGTNATREDALDCAHVNVSEGFCRHAKFAESPQKVKPLLGSFYSRVRLPGPGEEIEAGSKQSTSALSMCRGGMTPQSLPDVYNHLLSLADVEREVVALAPCCQVPDLLSVGGLIIVGDETQDGDFVPKL